MSEKCMGCQDLMGDTICISCLADPVKRELFHLITYLRAKNWEDSYEGRRRVADMYFGMVRKRVKSGMGEKEVLKELREIKSEIIKKVLKHD